MPPPKANPATGELDDATTGTNDEIPF